MKCLNCGKDFKFTFRASSRKYCSRECCISYNNKMTREKAKRHGVKKETHCVICGKELTGRQRAYCSPGCSYQSKINYLKDRNKDEYKKPKAEVKEEPKRKRGRPKKVPTINDINALAKAEGLTYGQYCAKHGLYERE